VEGPGVGKDHKEVMHLCGFAVLQLCDPTSSPVGRGREVGKDRKEVMQLCGFAVLQLCDPTSSPPVEGPGVGFFVLQL